MIQFVLFSYYLSKNFTFLQCVGIQIQSFFFFCFLKTPVYSITVVPSFPPLPSAIQLLPTPTVHPHTVVQVHGSFIHALWLIPSPSFHLSPPSPFLWQLSVCFLLFPCLPKSSLEVKCDLLELVSLSSLPFLSLSPSPWHLSIHFPSRQRLSGKSEGKGQNRCDLTHMWDGKQRVTKGLTKQNKTNSVITTGGGWGKRGEGGQIHGVWKLEEN